MAEKLPPRHPRFTRGRGWALVDWTALADAIGRELFDSHASVKVIERTAIRHYSRILCDTCREPRSLRQGRAWQELRTYLQSIAFYKVHDIDLAEDLTQEAQIRIWKNLECCRDPDRFLGFSQTILVNVIRDYYRSAYRRDEDSSEATWSAIEIAGGLEEEIRAATELDEDAVDRELHRLFEEKTKEAWLAILHACIENCQYGLIILELYFEGKTVSQVSNDLGIPPANVYVYHQRALQALRTCNMFWRFEKERLA